MSKPKIRFKGYEEDWEQRKLGEVATFINGRAYSQDELLSNGKYKVLRVGNFYTNDSWYFSDMELDEKYYANDGDLLYTWSATFGPHIWRGGKVIYHYHIWKIELSDILEKRFAVQLLEQDKAKILSDKNGSTMVHITKSGMEQKEVLLPSCVEEQAKIGAYFENLDHLITLHQRKCEETKKLKKYMLQKMFPQNGKRVPEIRFAGFTDDWEQRKLGDVTELKSASRVHKGEWTDSGVPFFRSSDVMAAINGTTNEKAYISEELYEKLSNASGKLEEGDVLVTGGGSVGNPYIVPNNEPLYTKDADLLWIKNQGRFYPYFLYEYFFSPTFRIYLSSISHVGTIAHYTITQLSETPISLPDIEEQIKVGEYFESLDRLITLHQRKYEELQKIKKFMLQNMFI
ncbi:restriction endonuclease subunit S [Anaerostipes hadrus]|uniref:restriction endonuclease subunit S n=2 Tax=Anaerostipes hadrus TaxID=649756 RepID=UPI002EDADC64